MSLGDVLILLNFLIAPGFQVLVNVWGFLPALLAVPRILIF